MKNKVEKYKNLVEKSPDFDLKGKNMLYTSANGYMFSQLNKNGELGIRFSKEVQEKYMKELNTTAFKSYGAIMKGYVLMPESFWDDHDILLNYLKESYQFVMSLEPK